MAEGMASLHLPIADEYRHIAMFGRALMVASWGRARLLCTPAIISPALDPNISRSEVNLKTSLMRQVAEGFVIAS